jgi:hypothetical protein
MIKRPKKLLDQVHDAIRFKHYSILIEGTYVNWVVDYSPIILTSTRFLLRPSNSP